MVENTRSAVRYTTKGKYDNIKRLLVDILAGQERLAPKAQQAGHIKSWKHDGAKALEDRPLWCHPKELLDTEKK